MVKDIDRDIKCATGNTGKCYVAVSPMSLRTLDYQPLRPNSTFGGVSGDCTDIKQPILLDRDKTCVVTFDLAPGVTLPTRVVHSISPEAVEALNDIYTRYYGLFVGWPTSVDTQIPYGGYSHFQTLEASDAQSNMWYQNSIEIQSNADGSYCAYAGYGPETTPYWYDTFDAKEHDARYIFTAHREWTYDHRNLGDVVDSNWNPSKWSSTTPPFVPKPQWNDPIPPGRGPTPQWIKTCANSYGNFPIQYISYPLQDAGKYCNYQTVTRLPFANHLEWCTIDPPLDFSSPGPPKFSVMTSQLQPWVPHTANGTVTQGLRAGDDYGSSHANPDDLAPIYWLGLGLPGQSIPTWDTPNGCAPIFATHDKCSDWQNAIWPDPQFRNLVSASPTANYRQNVWTEVEQWLVPQGYRPDPGDRETAVGRWIVDGGHEDFHTELHPTEAEVSTFLQTAPLHRYEPPESFNPSPIYPVPIQTNRLTMINVPLISDRWSELTHGNAATVTKFVITSDWQGEKLTFNIYPPPRPTPHSILHWEKEAGIMTGPGVNVLYSLEPAVNPNHLVITVPKADLPPLNVNTDYGQIKPDPNRRIVNAYMLWWEDQ